MMRSLGCSILILLPVAAAAAEAPLAEPAAPLSLARHGGLVTIIARGVRPLALAIHAHSDRVEIALAPVDRRATLAVDDAMVKRVSIDGGAQPRLSVKLRHGRRQTARLAAQAEVEEIAGGLRLVLRPAAAAATAPVASRGDEAAARTRSPSTGRSRLDDQEAPRRGAAASATAELVALPRAVDPPPGLAPPPAAPLLAVVSPAAVELPSAMAAAPASAGHAAPALAAAPVVRSPPAPAVASSPPILTAAATGPALSSAATPEPLVGLAIAGSVAAVDEAGTGRVVAGLVLALGLGLAVAARLRRRALPTLPPYLRIVSSQQIGGKARLLLLAAGRREFLVTVSDRGVTLLGQWLAEAAPSPAPTTVAETALESDFFARGLEIAVEESDDISPKDSPLPQPSPAVAGLLRLRRQSPPTEASAERAAGEWVRELLGARHREARS